MSIALVCFGWIVLVTTPNAVELSIWIGVLGWGCPISSNKTRMGTASLALIYNAPSSASAAEDITASIIVDRFRTAPLLGGNFELSDR